MSMEQEDKNRAQKVVITRAMVREHTRSICRENGLDEAFFESFWERLCADDSVYLEYVYYLIHGDFKEEEKVEGVSVVDILIWQIDHFKAQLDVDTTLTKRRSGSMVLLAFDTFMKMKKDPRRYLSKLREDTGTDYPGKFNGI